MMGSFGFEGRAYGLPKMINYWLVFYNAHVFAEHGLEVPTTWDELMAVAETLIEQWRNPIWSGRGWLPLVQLHLV